MTVFNRWWMEVGDSTISRDHCLGLETENAVLLVWSWSRSLLCWSWRGKIRNLMAKRCGDFGLDTFYLLSLWCSYYHPRSDGGIEFSSVLLFVCLFVCQHNMITFELLEISSRNFHGIILRSKGPGRGVLKWLCRGARVVIWCLECSRFCC